LTTSNSGSDFAARQCLRLENLFVAKCRLLIEFLGFVLFGRLLAFLGRCLVVDHIGEASRQTLKLAYPPVFDQSKGSVLQPFSGANMS
jgi:hypothetical protein